MGSKARELNANPQATSTSQPCGACPRRSDRVYEDQLWSWALTEHERRGGAAVHPLREG